MNQTTTDKLLDLLRVVVEKVNTNAKNINKLAEEIKKLKEKKRKKPSDQGSLGFLSLRHFVALTEVYLYYTRSFKHQASS